MADAREELLEKRRTLVARQRALRSELKAIQADIAAIDRVLGLIDPAFRPDEPRPRKSRTADGIFADGELTAATLATLRELDRPTTTADCARSLAQAQGLDAADPRLPEITNRVSATLGNLAAKGRVRRVGNGDGRALLWEVAR